MQTTEQRLLMYRNRLRNLLSRMGIPSNPAVSDEWIIDQIERLALQGPQRADEEVKKLLRGFPD